MELKLNIYNKDKTIEKTYVTQDADIMFGIVEDLLDVLDIEALTGNDKDSMLSAVSRLIRARKDVIYPLLKGTFDGLTDEEIRRTKLSELTTSVVQLAKFSMEQVKDNFRGRR